MLFYYIRHGEPTYTPDTLTEFGKIQADTIPSRLTKCGLDEIYASTSTRAIQTAEPTAKIFELDIKAVEFANERISFDHFSVQFDGYDHRKWCFTVTKMKELFHRADVRALGKEWYTHEVFKDYKFAEGVKLLRPQIFNFFEELGYKHDETGNRYKITKPNDKRIALFAHQGFGMFFLSTILDIPYPEFCTTFDICYTGVTVINFRDDDGYAYPKVLTLSNDSHLLKNDVDVKFQNDLYF